MHLDWTLTNLRLLQLILVVLQIHLPDACATLGGAVEQPSTITEDTKSDTIREAMIVPIGTNVGIISTNVSGHWNK